MVNRIGHHDNYDRWKPRNLRHYKTMAELCQVVGRTPARIKQLERQGRLPRPIRVKVGELDVRLYSPKEVAKIQEHFRNAKRFQA